MGMLEVIRYDPQTGEVQANLISEESAILAGGFDFILGRAELDKDYVDIATVPPELKKKPQMPITQDKNFLTADGEDSIVFSGIPEGATMQVHYDFAVIDDGMAEWSTDVPGEYKVIFSRFPYLDWESRVEARIL